MSALYTGGNNVAEPQDKTIPISKLLLDPDNPRHEEMESQREIMEWMASGKGKIGEKIYELAKDICEHGINHADRPIIVKSEDSARYLTLEGNRRLTALRFLNNPSTAPGSWPAKYSKLISNAQATIPSSLKCVLYADREEAYHFVELKHLGQANGAGTVDWGPMEKARQERRRSGKSRSDRSIGLLEHIRNSDLYSEEIKSLLDSINITTLDRILSDPDMRDFLGLEDSGDGKLSYRIAPEESSKGVSKLISDFGSGKKNVRDVINQEKREEYRNEFSPSEKPDQTKKLANPEFLNGSNRKKPKKKPDEKPKPKYEDPKKRRFLPLRGQSLSIDGKRFNRARLIYDELKNLQIDIRSGERNSYTYPNAVSVLFRSFLEMSVEAYLEETEMPCPNPNASWSEMNLLTKIKKVMQDLFDNHNFKKKVLGNIERKINNSNGPAHTNQLNNYVHNYHETVQPSALKEAWEVYFPLLEAIWEVLHKETS